MIVDEQSMLLTTILMCTLAGSISGQETTITDETRPGPFEDEGFSPEELLYRRVAEVIGASRREKPAYRAPSTVTVIDGSDIRRSGAWHLSDVLRLVPGMQVLRTSISGSNVSARMFHDAPSAAQGTLALINGRLAYNEFFGNVLWDQLTVDIDDVERIEVVRGPGGFTYGPNAMHGIVSISTRSPLDYEEDTTRFSTSAGSFGANRIGLTQVRRFGDSGLKTTLAWEDFDGFDRGENVGDEVLAEFRYEKELGDHQRVQVTAGIDEQKAELLLPTLFVVPATDLAIEPKTVFAKADYLHDDLKVQLFWTGFETSVASDAFYAPFDVDMDTIDLDLQYSLLSQGGHTVTFGSGYRYATFTTRNQDVSNGRHHTNLAWSFVQDEFAVGENLTITTGVRIDEHSTAGTNVSPRIAAVWKLDEQQSLRASAGTGFRSPSLREIWFGLPTSGVPGFPGTIFTVAGNEDLESEKIRSFEIAYAGAPLGSVKGGINAYYNLIDDLIEFGLVGTDLIPTNEVDAEAWGIELEADYLIRDTLSGFINYAYGRRRDRDTNEYSRSSPRHTANIGLRSSTTSGLSSMLWMTYMDETAFEAAPGIFREADEYTLLNGQVSYSFRLPHGTGQLFLGGFNLLDDEHREHPDAERYGRFLQGGLRLTF